MFAINNSREQSAGKIDDPFPESNKRSTARESLLMGPDRLVILLINATDMSDGSGGAPEVDPPRDRESSIKPEAPKISSEWAIRKTMLRGAPFGS